MYLTVAFLPWQIAGNFQKQPCSIHGQWRVVEKKELAEVNYGHLEFESDGVIVLSTAVDTLYSYNYRVERGKLFIFRAANNDTVECRILKISCDSLILSSLLEKNEVQRYYRSDKR